MKLYAIRRKKVRKYDFRPSDVGISVVATHDGTPVVEGQFDNITVEETVMEWSEAEHIRAWFVKNLQEDQPSQREYPVGTDKLDELLSVCEKVLNASHLVPERNFAGALYGYPSPQVDALRSTRKVIKNVNAAHKLLPAVPGDSSTKELYGEAYLKAVEDTRSWILRMIADRKEGNRSDIYIVSCW